MPDAHVAWPTEIRVQDNGRILKVSFDDGQIFELPSELLRVLSPSAEVRGHGRADRKIVGGKRAVTIIGVDPVGSYAVRLRFGDGHDTGLYTWGYLHELGCAQAAKWDAYLAALEAAGLDRDRPGEAAHPPSANPPSANPPSE